MVIRDIESNLPQLYAFKTAKGADTFAMKMQYKDMLAEVTQVSVRK